MKVVIYIRVSSQEQVSGYSLDAQEEACRAWAAEQGHDVVKVYVEPGMSARTDKRPEFQAMVRMIKLGLAEAILIHKSDRIARNLLDLLSYRADLEKTGKRILSVLEPFFNDDSPESRMVVGIIGAVNEFYSANLSREVQKGQGRKAREGSFPGGKLPLGYLRNDEKTIIPDPERAGFITSAFAEFASGDYTLKTWAARAKALGLRNHNDNPVSVQSWQKLFRNVFFVGQFVWSGEIYDGDHPALIDEDTFTAVQDLLDEQGSGGSQTRHFWLLAGLLWSDQHHRQMTGTLAKGKYAYYRAKANGGPEHLIPAAELEQRVINLLGTIRGSSRLAPESWRLALSVANTVADLWPLLTTDPDRKALLNLVVLPHGLIIAPGGAITEVYLRDGFTQG